MLGNLALPSGLDSTWAVFKWLSGELTLQYGNDIDDTSIFSWS
jgi:hypothetical protein